MKIAILGWGSLIWCPGDLAVEGRWRPGPSLPIEFVRKSNDDRVTLVLWGTRLSPTYWVKSSLSGTDEACENLRIREGRPKYRFIHYTTGDGLGVWKGEMRQEDGNFDVSEAVCEWIETQPDVEAAVWTGLPSKGFHVDSGDLVSEVIAHLEGLDEPTMRRAKEYVQLAPEAVRTPVRETIEKELGWMPRSLPANLFEESTSNN